MKTFLALPQTTLNLGFSVVCATHGYVLIHLANLSLVPSLVFFSAILLLKVLICAIILPHLECMSLVMSNLLSLSSPLLLYPCHLPIHNPTLSPHGFLPSSHSNQPSFHRDIQHTICSLTSRTTLMWCFVPCYQHNPTHITWVYYSTNHLSAFTWNPTNHLHAFT